MSVKRPISAEQIRDLSQREGLIDREIAERLGCHRVTVTRIRLRDNIPRPNLNNRHDKEQVCKLCGKVELLQRKHRIKKYCADCKKISDAQRSEKKRIYMRERQK